jgi:hypothetical protein
MKRRRIEPAVGFDRPAILAELHHIFGHCRLALKIVVGLKRRGRHFSSPQ